MTQYRDPQEAFGPLAEVIIITALMAGFLISLGVGTVLLFTQLPGEELHELIFWPSVGAIGFGVGLVNAWITKPWDYTNTGKKP